MSQCLNRASPIPDPAHKHADQPFVSMKVLDERRPGRSRPACARQRRTVSIARADVRVVGVVDQIDPTVTVA